MTIPTAITITKMVEPLDWAIAHKDEGKTAAMDTKINSDIPLPTPRSVIISPSHIMRPVPAVMVITIRMMAYQASLAKSWLHAGPPELPNIAPLRATVIKVVDWRSANPMVR